tara:strand:- start:178 stop:861 length:684 start_codon:yes stop_codon:yes gene_type:complete
MYRIFIIFLFLFIYSCSSINTEPKYKIRTFSKNNPEILLMPIDIEICELTLAGLCEPNAVWTKKSKENMILGFEELLKKRNAKLVEFKEKLNNDNINQLIKLHTQVGHEIISNEYGQFKMPTKEKFNWSIGKKVRLLNKNNKSDYVIFIYFRDQYSSEERVIYSILTAVLFPGIIPIGGRQVAFASLVNLKNGDIAWFNGYYRSFGDVRDFESAKKTLNKLFEQFPG